ncbi:hypothetical protein MSEO_28610 [Mycobacterium seoulense]|uniref:Uncharacterized protein n=1 Tax=Mycobacterium seoulense TaxID=386911 RepID=A0A7I7P2Q9_9MYCO|nr:hypothetical protein MSEO_28610 [Mycobacterium seoulense]
MPAATGLWITRQLEAAADAVALLLDFSADPDFSLDEDFSLDPELDPESVDEDPLVVVVDFLPDSRLSVR